MISNDTKRQNTSSPAFLLGNLPRRFQADDGVDSWEGRMPHVGLESNPFLVMQVCEKYPKCWDTNQCECCGF